MKSYRIFSILALAAVTLITGCSGSDECSEAIDAAYCSNDGKIQLVCENGKWVEHPCQNHEVCGYTSQGATCIASDVACTPNTTSCTANGMIQKCSENGTWTYEICNGTCQNGICTPSSPGSSNPNSPIVTPNLKGIVKLTCSSDKKSIVSVYDDGKTTSQSCLQAVGFDAECQEYSNGLAGCTRPQTCNEVFSQNGTCLGNNRHYCDTQYITPKPATENCQVQGKSCTTFQGKAQCSSTCTTPGELTCTVLNEIEYITQCTEAQPNPLTNTASSLCISNTESATCQNGEIVKTTCAPNTQCIPELGQCAETCSADKLGDFKCTPTGELVTCTPISTGYAYTSVGTRHCLGNTRISCKKGEDNTYAKVEMDCTNYTDNNGNTVSGTCVTELQFYPDMDVCYFDPDSDGRCGSLTDAGTCNGATLQYCDESSDNAYTIDCAQNKTNSACSIFAGYADCRKPCQQAGKATCTTTEGMSMITLCAPDDVTGALTEIQGQSICLGDELHTCDENGKTTIINCAANGGICQTNTCLYPACAAPTCLADDAILACQITSDGTVIGASLETTYCLPDGTCQSCLNGQIQSH